MKEIMFLAVLRVYGIKLEDVIQAFNQLTVEAKDDGLLWVANDSIGHRHVRWIGDVEEAILDEIEDWRGSYSIGYNPEMVTEVEFVSATSGSILRWTRNRHGFFEGVEDSNFGVFEYQEGRPYYRGVYYKAFMEALS